MINAKKINYYAIILFSLGVFSIGAYNILFNQDKIDKSLLPEYGTPIKINILRSIDKIKYTGRAGDVLITRNGKLVWEMEQPKQLPIHPQIISDILGFLNNLSIKKLHMNDPINMSSFSLDKPLAKIKLQGPLGHYGIDIGITNSIDGSTYIRFDHKDMIYQVNSPAVSLEKLEWKDFVDTRLFTHQYEKIEEIQIKARTGASVVFKHDGTKWTIPGFNTNAQQATNLVNKILALKIQTILDALPQSAVDFLNKETQAPLIKIKITDEANIHEYNITRALDSIPGLEAFAQPVYVATASNRSYSFFIGKDTIATLLAITNPNERDQLSY